MPRFVAEALADHLDTYAAANPEALVFTDPEGGPLGHSKFLRRIWRPALKAARLPTNLTPHELRHTCAALLIAEGADPKAVQAQLRHSSIQVTFDVYGHLFPGHLDDVMGRLDAALREALAAPRQPGGSRNACNLPREMIERYGESSLGAGNECQTRNAV